MSWSRRLLKTNAKKAVRQNYWRFVAVCFLVTLICGSSFTSTQLFWQNPIDEIDEFLPGAMHYFSENTSVSSMFSEIARRLFQTENLQWLVMFSASALLWVLYKVFIANIVRVNAIRFFLETRTYPKTSVKKIGYLYKGRAIENPAKIMFSMYVRRFLWWFTVIGGIIKTYEYAMIPYILAENPDISKQDAFRLSKEMMRGEKFGLFVLQISFAPWFLLGLITMGLSNIFYLNAYLSATEAEFYMRIRRDIVASRCKSSRFFVDNYLENKPSEDEILINMFVLEKNYMPNLESDEFSQNVYPMFLRGKDSKWYETPYRTEELHEYHITTYILLFFITSFIGWGANIMLGLMRQGYVINGGVLYGPWVPVVGLVSVLILVVGQELRKHPIVNIGFVAVFTTTVQYFYLGMLEAVKGYRYWDFSSYFLNLNGRICLSSTVVICGLYCALFYLFAPEIDRYLEQIPLRKKWKICIGLFALLVLDIIISVYVRWF